MNKEFGGGMKLEGGVARGSNAAAVKTDNLFMGGNEISPADPHPARGDGWRRAALCAHVTARPLTWFRRLVRK